MPERRYTFPATHRLGGRNTFRALRETGVRVPRGPLTGWLKPNDLPHPRLGISIGRHVGGAVKRNRIKRLLRESFRLLQHDFQIGFDLILSVKPMKHSRWRNIRSC